MSLIGYARPTATMAIEPQLQLLRRVGCLDIRIASSLAGAASSIEPCLEETLNSLDPGDTLVVARIDRLAASRVALAAVLATLKRRGVGLREAGNSKAQRVQLEALTTAIDVVSRIEEDARRERHRAGIRRAKGEGLYRGRKPTIDKAKVLSLHNAGVRAAEIARKLKIGRASVYRLIRDAEETRADIPSAAGHVSKNLINTDEAAQGQKRPTLSSRRSSETSMAAVQDLATRETWSSDRIYSWGQIERRFAAIVARKRSDRAFFYRHGETLYNREGRVTGQHDPLLSELGISQARELSVTAPSSIRVAFCSALRRSRQTLEYALAPQTREDLPIFEDARLNEISLGELEGGTRVHLPAFAAGEIDFAPPGGETYRQAARRVFSFTADLFDYLARYREPSNAVVFAHAGVLRIVSSLNADIETAQLMFSLNLANASRVNVTSRCIGLKEFWRTHGGDNDDGSNAQRN